MESNKSLTILHTESSHGWGGQEIRVLTESRELIRNGYSVILAADPVSPIFKRAHLYEVPVYSVRLRKKRLTEVLHMYRALEALKPSVVSCHSSTDHWVVAICRLFCKFEFRIVRTRHVSAPIHRNLSTRWLYNRGADFIMTTGESIRQEAIKDGFLPSNRIRSVPTGIPLEHYVRSDELGVRSTLGIEENTFLFGNVATLRSWKGHQFLLEAFAQLPKDSNCKLLIVGDGPMRDSLVQKAVELKIADFVIFAGHHQDVTSFFNCMDCFVFPSYANEGIPQAILQAVAYGLPIITTDAGSISEAVSELDNKVMVRKKDVNTLKNAMMSAIQRKPPLNFTTPSRSLLEKISIETMTEQVVSVYISVTRNIK